MKIPCKDCLCFPICKNQAVMKSSTEGYCIYITTLVDRCELFSECYTSKCFDKDEVTEFFGATWWVEKFK